MTRWPTPPLPGRCRLATYPCAAKLVVRRIGRRRELEEDLPLRGAGIAPQHEQAGIPAGHQAGTGGNGLDAAGVGGRCRHGQVDAVTQVLFERHGVGRPAPGLIGPAKRQVVAVIDLVRAGYRLSARADPEQPDTEPPVLGRNVKTQVLPGLHGERPGIAPRHAPLLSSLAMRQSPGSDRRRACLSRSGAAAAPPPRTAHPPSSTGYGTGTPMADWPGPEPRRAAGCAGGCAPAPGREWAPRTSARGYRDELAWRRWRRQGPAPRSGRGTSRQPRPRPAGQRRDRGR